MNPQFEQPQGLRLPQPSLESAPAPMGSEGQPLQEGAPQREPAAAAPVMPAPLAQQPGMPVPLPVDPQAASLPTAAPADDTSDNTLDEEWISKAKQIVGLTHDDPYRQSNELSRFKADYLKVRHNRIIKTAEDRPK